MIAINIRGTGGSGKSTLVKRVMQAEGWANCHPWMREGRKRPAGYQLWKPNNQPSSVPDLFVPGHYETDCGGCDTLKTVDEVYDGIGVSINRGSSVLYEGIMVADDVRRAVELDKKLKEQLNQPSMTGTIPRYMEQGHARPQLYVIALNTDIEDCLAAIRDRRRLAAAKAGKLPLPLSEKNTRDRHKRLQSGLGRLRDAGVTVERLSRDDAFARCRELLGV